MKRYGECSQRERSDQDDGQPSRKPLCFACLVEGCLGGSDDNHEQPCKNEKLSDAPQQDLEIHDVDSESWTPNGPRLSCGALKKDSFPNLRAPSASSAG